MSEVGRSYLFGSEKQGRVRLALSLHGTVPWSLGTVSAIILIDPVLCSHALASFLPLFLTPS